MSETTMLDTKVTKMEVDDERMSVEMSEIKPNYKRNLMQKTVLDSFAKLSKQKEKLRVDGGLILLKHLSQNPCDDDKTTKELHYALERLIRGLGTSRPMARAGFFATLVALLSLPKIKSFTVAEITEIMIKELHSTGSNSKGESGDIYLGQINACGALIRSKLLEKGSKDEQKGVLEIMINASKQRSHLQLPTYMFLINYLENISEANFVNTLWPAMKDEVGKPWVEQTIDSIHFILLAQQKFPSIVKNKFINKQLGTALLITKESITYICEIMMNVPRLKTLHNPFYESFCKEISKSECLVDFWALIDDQLAKPTRNKEIISITMLIFILKNISNTSKIPELITSNFIDLLLKRLTLLKQRKKDELNVKSALLLETLVQTLTTEGVASKTKLNVLKKLVLSPGDFMFEKTTGSKVCQRITHSLDADCIKKLAKIYREIIVGTRPKATSGKYKVWLNMERVYAAQLLSKLLNIPAVVHEHDWRLEQLKFFLNVGLFSSLDGQSVCSKDIEGNVGSELADAIKECFYSSLSHKLKKLDDLRNILSGLVHYINILFENDGLSSLRTEVEIETTEAWQDMYTMVKKLENKTKPKKAGTVVPVFHTLFLVMGLHLFKDAKLAKSSLLELKSCYERLQKDRKQNKTKELQEGEDESDEPEWIEVVVDWFLSILSQESSLLRNVTSCVFPHLCRHLNATAVHQILAVVDSKNEENPLTMGADSSDSEDEDYNNDSTNDNDVESSDDEDMDIDEDDEYDDDTVTDKLRMAVSQALGSAVTESDQESIDLDDIDEDEGNRLNEALEEAFQVLQHSRSGKKSKKQTNDAKTLTHFRIRILDLIEIYLENDPSMYICLEIILPLIQTFEFCVRDPHQKPLENRIRTCVKKMSVLKKFSTTEDVTQELLTDMLKSLMGKGNKTTLVFQSLSDIITECCTFIIRCSQGIQIGTEMPSKKSKIVQYSPIGEVYKDGLYTFFTRSDCVLPITLFKSAINIVWMDNWLLVPVLVECAFNFNLRPFRRSHAIELLTTFYRNNRLFMTDIKNTTKLLKNIEKDLSEKTISLLNNSIGNSDSKDKGVKDTFFGNLMTFLSVVKHCHTELVLKEIPDVIDWDNVGKSVLNYTAGVKLGTTARKACKKLCRVLNITTDQRAPRLNGISKQNNNIDSDNKDGVKKKQKMSKESSLNKSSASASNGQSNDGDESSMEEDIDDDDNIGRAINKKRQRSKALSKDTQLLKKEAQQLRMKAASEGLETINFSRINVEHIQHEEPTTSSSDEDSDAVTQNKNNKSKSSSTKKSGDSNILGKKANKKI